MRPLPQRGLSLVPQRGLPQARFIYRPPGREEEGVLGLGYRQGGERGEWKEDRGAADELRNRATEGVRAGDGRKADSCPSQTEMVPWWRTTASPRAD